MATEIQSDVLAYKIFKFINCDEKLGDILCNNLSKEITIFAKSKAFDETVAETVHVREIGGTSLDALRVATAEQYQFFLTWYRDTKRLFDSY